MKIARYGWKPDLPDHRDRHFVRRLSVALLPSFTDLRPQMPPVYDQGDLGSCTANAIAAAIEYDECTQQDASVTPSRLFIYYNERAMEGNEGADTGAFIRDGIKSVNTTGVCPEPNWPYDTSQFAVRPSDDCYTNATEKAMLYERLDNTDLDALRGCLAQGLPFVFGFTVYESFENQETARTGIVQMPLPNESAIGGHAVLAVGHNDETQRFTGRNSWKDTWGQSGYFTIPYSYLTNPDLADDFWVIQRVANVQPSVNQPLT